MSPKDNKSAAANDQTDAPDPIVPGVPVIPSPDAARIAELEAELADSKGKNDALAGQLDASQQDVARLTQATTASKGTMASTAASDAPLATDSHRPFPDVDPPELVEQLDWETPAQLVKAIDEHVRTSHGLEPDKAMLKKVAGFLRKVLHIKDEPVV